MYGHPISNYEYVELDSAANKRLCRQLRVHYHTVSEHYSPGSAKTLSQLNELQRRAVLTGSEYVLSNGFGHQTAAITEQDIRMDAALKLGAGAYGQVHSRGEHAVKTTAMFGCRGCNGNVLEAAIAAELRDDPQPHLIRVESVDVDQVGAISISMERGNVSLSEYLRRTTKLELQREAGPIIKQIAEGLSALHAKGYVHGDLKPANIMCVPSASNLESNEQVVFKIIDFGCSRPLQEGSKNVREGGGGTHQYSAPETFFEGRSKPTPEWDVWGLGCILYRLIFGGHLIRVAAKDSQNRHAYLEVHKREQNFSNDRRFGRRPQGVTPALFAYMQSLLELDPKQRARLAPFAGSQASFLPRTLDPISDRWNPDRTHMIDRLYRKQKDQPWLIPLAVNMLDRYCEAVAAGTWGTAVQPVSKKIQAACMWLSYVMLTPTLMEVRGNNSHTNRDVIMQVARVLRFRLYADTCLSLLLLNHQHQDIDHDRIHQLLLVEARAQNARELYLEPDSGCSSSTEEQPCKRRKVSATDGKAVSSSSCNSHNS